MYQIEQSQEGILHLKFGDKQGTAVLKRLASLSNRTASTLILGDSNMPRINQHYVEECASKIVSLYKNIQASFETVVLGSPHQASVYVAELMNAPFLPLQFIGFTESLQKLNQLNCLKIIGCDYDYTHLCWAWCKIGSIDHMPKSYIDILSMAKNVIVIRANSEFRLKGKSDFCMGKIKDDTYVHSSIKLWKKLPFDFQAGITPPTQECKNIRQWEFGLPDQTISALKQLWEKIHPNNDQSFILIQDSIVDLYKFIPFLYFQCYKSTKTQIRGISLNPYYTLHPYYEKRMGLVPFIYYNFSILSHYFQSLLNQITKYSQFKVEESKCICFANMVEKQKDLQVIKKFWKENGLEKGWFSVGFDCILKKGKKMPCKNIFGEDVPSPHQKIHEWTRLEKKQQLSHFVPLSYPVLIKVWQLFKVSLVQMK